MTSLFIFGSGECDQLGLGDDGPPETKRAKPIPSFAPPMRISSIACGGMHTIALSTEGLVYSWGCNDEKALGRTGQENVPQLVEVPTRSTGVSAGDSHSIAYNTQINLVFMWGSYRNSLTGQMHDPYTEPKRIGTVEFGRRALKKVVSGAHHTLVLADDRLFAWGDPESGKIGRDIRTRRRNESSLNIEGLMEKGVVDVFAGAYTSFLRNDV